MQGTNWVKCSERLPEDNSIVLTKSDDANVRAMFFYDKDKNPTFISFVRKKILTLGCVTHWMPLPLPPMPEGE